MAASSIFDVLVKFSGNSAEAVTAVKKVSSAEKEAAAARKKQVEEQKKAWETLKTQTVDLAKLIRNASIAIGGAMIAIAKSAANYGDEILTASEKTGESVENLSRLQYAAKIGETSLDELTNGMGLLSRRMKDASDGNKEYQKTFDELGIPIKNADGSLRSATDVMLDFADKAKNSTNNTELIARAMDLLGRSGTNLLPFFKKGKDGLQALFEESDRLGTTLSQKAAEGGDAFNDSLTALNAALTGIRATIGEKLLPILTEYVTKITDWIAANREVIAQKVTDFFKGFINIVKGLVEFFAKWKTVILAVAAALIALSAAAKMIALINAVKTLLPMFSAMAGKIGLSGGALAKFGIAGAAAAAAVWAISKAFDFLNKQLDEAEKRTASLVKTQKKQEDTLAAVSKGLGHEAWGQLVKDLDLVGKTSTERFGALQQWAVQNKATNKEAAKVWGLLNKEIDKNKEKIEKSREALKGTATAAGETAAQISEIARGLSDDILQLEAENQNRIASNENLSVEARREAAERLFEYQKEILNRKKQAEIDALEKTNQATDANLSLLSQKYKMLGAQLVNDNLDAQQKITDDEKKAIQARLDAEAKYREALASIGESILKAGISKLEQELNAEETSKERKLEIAQEIYDLKMKLLDQETAAEMAQKMASATTAEQKKAIEDEYAKYAAIRQADVRSEWEKTKKQIEDGAADLSKVLNDILATVSKGAGNIQSGLSTIDKLLGTDTGGLQDAIGSGVAAFSSGASAVGSFMSGDVIGGISSALSAVGSIVDLIGSLTESTAEGYVKQLAKQGFNDTYSQELLDKMSEVSDAMGDKSYGIKAYIEDFFKETNIDNQEEFGRMSDLLNESIGEYIEQGHTADEAYEKFGDELEQLTDAQEEYGFETVASLDAMLVLQKQQTKAGKVSGLTDVVGNLEKVIQGMSGYDFSAESWNSVFGMFQDTFKQLQAQGLSMQEIQAIIGPTMDKAIKIAEDKGLDTSSMQQLKDFYSKMTGAAGLLDVISGLDGAVKGLSETGSITQENINQSATAAMETYQKLLDEGFTQNEALAQMGGLLGDISASAEQYGYAIPEELQGIIDAAEGIGALKVEKPLDETLSDGIAEGFDRAVGVLKDFFGSLPAYARGGIVRTAEGEETIARVHGGEYVLGADAVRRAGVNAINTVNSTGLMPTKYVPVYNPGADTQQLAQELKNTSNDLKNQQAAFMAGFGDKIGKSLKEGIAAAMPQTGRTEINTNVKIDEKSIISIFQTAMNNGSLYVNANAVRVK